MRHRCRCAVSRITRIRVFPLFFHNGCSQSSRFPTAGQRERSSGNEIDCFPENKITAHVQARFLARAEIPFRLHFFSDFSARFETIWSFLFTRRPRCCQSCSPTRHLAGSYPATIAQYHHLRLGVEDDNIVCVDNFGFSAEKCGITHYKRLPGPVTE